MAQVDYFSFSNLFIAERNLDNYTGVYSPEQLRHFHHLLPPCTRQVLRLLGAPLSPDPAAPVGSGSADGVGSGGADEAREPPALISTYCCAVFTASRAAIRRHPYEVWRALYGIAGSGAAPCVWSDALADAEARGARHHHNFGEGFIMEHTWHVAFGEPLQATPHRGDETCGSFRCGRYCPAPERAPELGVLGPFA